MKIKQSLTVLSICCFSVVMLSLPLGAETYFFVGSNFPVLSTEDEDGHLGGIGVEIVRIICSRLGHTPEISFFPWARAQALVKSGKADVLIVPYKTPEREKWMDYSKDSFFDDTSFFFVRKDSNIVWKGDLSSIRGLRIGMVQGWSVGEAFEKGKNSLHIDYAPTIDVCFKKLITGRVDLVPTQEREARAAFRRMRLPENEYPKTILPMLASHSNYFGFSRKKRNELKEFKAAFEKELKKMIVTGELEELKTKAYAEMRYE